MTETRKHDLDNFYYDVFRIKRKLQEITKEEKQYADSLDECDDEEYFERKFADETVEILETAQKLCEDLMNKMCEAQG